MSTTTNSAAGFIVIVANMIEVLLYLLPLSYFYYYLDLFQIRLIAQLWIKQLIFMSTNLNKMRIFV